MKILLPLIFMLALATSVLADDSHKAPTNAIDTTLQNKVTTLSSQMKLMNDMIEKLSKSIAANKSQHSGNRTVTSIEKVIASLPMLLVCVVMFIIFGTLRKGGYRVGDALTENLPLYPTAPVPVANAPAAAELQPTSYKETKSSSRVIAFLTGMTTLVILSCLTSYWMYTSFADMEPVSLSGLKDIFLALGLGVIPYGFNRVSSVFK